MSHSIYRRIPGLLAKIGCGFGLLCSSLAPAQTPLAIYTDSYVSGFDDWSWAPHNVANTSPVHSGNNSISVSAAVNQAISFHHSDLDTTLYTNFSFWAHGGSSGGQRLRVYAELSAEQPGVDIATPLSANTWQQFTLSLSSLGVANKPNFSRINIVLRSGGTTGTFYVDDVQFGDKAPPAAINVGVQAAQTLRTVDARHFGVNLAIWDNNYEPNNYATTAELLREMGMLYVRIPGGSLSDEYHWTSNTTLTNTWQWQTSVPEFIRVATNANAQIFVTVNYGSGSPQEAAAWVAYANADANLFGTPQDVTLGVDSGGRDWLTAGYWSRLRSRTAAQNPDNQFDFLAIGRTAPLGIKDWEIGNENYGTWERDTNALPNHAYTYARRATNYIALMKAVDPTIKIGLVSVPGETAYNNGYNDHLAFNPRTGQNNNGWTPVLLTTIKNLGVTPDFLVHHHYPQWTNPQNVPQSPVNDVTLLLSTGNWATDAAMLRQHVTDYFGTTGTNIELLVTENNSDSGQQGRQSTSLVNGIYYADSLAQLLKTEFKGFVWWDLRNGTDSAGYFGSHLHGWRNYGDLGMVNGLNTRHPTFYAAKLMQWFVRPGDKILSATNDYPWLGTHAARQENGAIALLVLNKSKLTNLTGQIKINGFTPSSAATIRSFGIANDEAARTNGPAVARDISTNVMGTVSTNFTYDFPPLSATMFTLTPDAPRLNALPPAAPGEFVFQLQGQSAVRYVLQNSTNLMTWTIVSTNTLIGSSLNLTNPIITGNPQQYWRALWQP